MSTLGDIGTRVGSEFKADRLRIEAVETYKVDKVLGKQLSTEDYSTAEKSKLAGIEADANKYVHPVSGVTAGTYTKVTVDANGHTTAGATLAASDIPALDASKITSGTISADRLPSYVDDVLEYVDLAGFPVSGETGKIYIALDTNKAYRWSGSSYVYITSGAVDMVNGQTGIVEVTTITGNAGTASKLQTARSIALSGDVTGSASFDGSEDVSITATITPNSVTLGTDTVGDYVIGITEGTGIVVDGTSAEGWSPTIAIADIGTAGTYKSVTTNAQGQVISGTNPTTVDEYGITDVYTKVEVQTTLPKVGFDTTNVIVPGVGQMAWNQDEGTVDLGLMDAVLQVGQEFFVKIRNASGSTISNGTLVMASGSIGNSGRITVVPHDGTQANASRAIGVMTHDILDGADGLATVIGKIRNINTTGSLVGETWVDGDILYSKPVDSGRLTNVAPTDTQISMKVAMVVKAHVNGTLYVRVNGFDENHYKAWVQTRLDSKVDKIVGKGLSTEDYTSEEKTKLSTLNNYTLPVASSTVLGGVKAGTNISIDSNGVISAASTMSLDWEAIVNSPTTLSGYGITDAYTKSQVDTNVSTAIANLVETTLGDDPNFAATVATQLELKADKSYMDTQLATKVDNSTFNTLNLTRADKYLASQNVVEMIYDTQNKLSKVRYNNTIDVDYEVLTYNVDGKLLDVAHYVDGVLKGNTVLNYSAGKLVSAPFVAI